MGVGSSCTCAPFSSAPDRNTLSPPLIVYSLVGKTTDRAIHFYDPFWYCISTLPLCCSIAASSISSAYTQAALDRGLLIVQRLISCCLQCQALTSRCQTAAKSAVRLCSYGCVVAWLTAFYDLAGATIPINGLTPRRDGRSGYRNYWQWPT